MSNILRLIKNRPLSFIKDRKGVIGFEYLLVIASVSVGILVAVAVGAPAMLNVIMVDGLCEQFDDLIPPGVQWACHGGLWPEGWYIPNHAPH